MCSNLYVIYQNLKRQMSDADSACAALCALHYSFFYTFLRAYHISSAAYVLLICQLNANWSAGFQRVFLLHLSRPFFFSACRCELEKMHMSNLDTTKHFESKGKLVPQDILAVGGTSILLLTSLSCVFIWYFAAFFKSIAPTCAPHHIILSLFSAPFGKHEIFNAFNKRRSTNVQNIWAFKCDRQRRGGAADQKENRAHVECWVLSAVCGGGGSAYQTQGAFHQVYAAPNYLLIVGLVITNTDTHTHTCRHPYKCALSICRLIAIVDALSRVAASISCGLLCVRIKKWYTSE